MVNPYYVYEILIDDVPIYVGSSQDRIEKYPVDDPHRYHRLKAHGYFLEKVTAINRLQENNLRTFKREILEAKANDRKLSFKILGDNLTSEEAAIIEQSEISKHGIRIKTKQPVTDERGEVKMVETYVGGTLINKFNTPKRIPKNDKGNFTKAIECSKKQNWWANLSPEQKQVYADSLKRRGEEYKEKYPEKYAENMKKFIAAGRGVTSKERRSESTRIKQSENMKKRWARHESWIPAKNALSAKCLRGVVTDPNIQKRKVQIIYNKMKDNGKNPNKWRESFLELVDMGICFNNGYRDWKNYFSSFEEIENFKYIKPAIK